MLLCVRENTRQTLDKPSQRADRRLYRCEHFRVLTSPSVCDAMEPARVVLIHEGKGRTRRSPRQPWPYALHVLDSEGIRIAVTWFSSVRQSSPGGQGGKLVRLPVLCGLLFTSFHLRGTGQVGCAVAFVPLAGSRRVHATEKSRPHFTATRMDERFPGSVIQAVPAVRKCASPQATATRTASMAVLCRVLAR
jgi:hypothetical protein